VPDRAVRQHGERHGLARLGRSDDQLDLPVVPGRKIRGGCRAGVEREPL
jgi:hypothetical protein